MVPPALVLVAAGALGAPALGRSVAGAATPTLAWRAPANVGVSEISCATASFCVGTGGSSTSPDTSAVYDGTSWSILPMPGSMAQASVSCPTSTFCAAVGNPGSSAGASVHDSSATVFSAGSWSPIASIGLPLPAGASSIGFAAQSVSCTSATFCVVIGNVQTQTPSGTTTITTSSMDASVYDGSTWSTAAPIGSSANAGSVACTSPTSCVEVDNLGGSAAWDGTTWSTLPAPSGVAAFTQVSCGAAGNCVAAAIVFPSRQSELMTFSGTGWSAPVPVTALPAGELVSGVACVGSSGCFVLGAPNDQLAYFDGTTVTALPAIGTVAMTTPGGFACPSLSLCAVDLPSGSVIGGGSVVLGTATAGPVQPTVTGVTPPSGPATGGTTITITGTGFAPGALVTVTGPVNPTYIGPSSLLVATGVVVVSPTEITAVVPDPLSGWAANSIVDVEVTTGGGSSADSAADQFTYGTGIALPVAAGGGLLVAVLLGGGLTLVMRRRRRMLAAALG